MTNSTKLFFKKSPQIWKIILFAVSLLFFTVLFVLDLIEHSGIILLLDVATYLLLTYLLSNLLVWQLLGGDIIEIDDTGITFYKQGASISKKHHISRSTHPNYENTSHSVKKITLDYSHSKRNRIMIIDDNMISFQIGQDISLIEAENLVIYLNNCINNKREELPEVLKKYQIH